MAIGEAGTISDNTTFTGEPIQVTFTEPLTNPVIALMSTDFGGNKFSLRVIETQLDANGDATGFTFTIDEWENHDGPHPRVEDINWIAVQEGVHTLPDGRIVEARHAEVDGDGEPVTFTQDFGAPPVVLTTVASDRSANPTDTDRVDSDPFDVTSSGFTLDLEEAESQDGAHGFERVGWIAIQPGAGTDSGAATSGTIDSDWATYSTGDDFTNPIIVGETQTRNDPDPGNVIWRNDNATADTIELRFEEDTSVDGDENHAPETVGIVTFEEGQILCFTAGTEVATLRGHRRVEDLRPGDLVMTRDNGAQTLRWTCRAPIGPGTGDPALRPVMIPAHAFGYGVPSRDTLVSPQHRLLVSGARAQMLFDSSEVLAPAKALFSQSPTEEPVTYVHLLFDHHEIVFANGMAMESFHPGDMSKEALSAPAREELFTLFPDLRSAPQAWGPPARQVLKTREARLLVA